MLEDLDKILDAVADDLDNKTFEDVLQTNIDHYMVDAFGPGWISAQGEVQDAIEELFRARLGDFETPDEVEEAVEQFSQDTVDELVEEGIVQRPVQDEEDEEP